MTCCQFLLAHLPDTAPIGPTTTVVIPSAHYYSLSASRALLIASIMARQRGSPNYQNQVLIGIVEQMLPNGSYAWTAVADAYQRASGEKTVRSGDDVRKHWLRKLCNNMKKPTGSTGENEDRIHDCIIAEMEEIEREEAAAKEAYELDFFADKGY